MSTADLSDTLGFLDRVIHDEASRANLAFWATHHFGDTTPGASTARFHAAVEKLIALWAEHAPQHVDDSSGESDPLDDEDDESLPQGD
jgi:hypothetical protein